MMVSEPYKKLIDELCKLASLTLRPVFYERADLQVEQVFFSLVQARQTPDAGAPKTSAPALPASSDLAPDLRTPI
ncbi:MAG: hypothetical protein GAK35_02828 [Herbaspirillum frisingense]|uniref:Uncharacterized protein n=1 Tax=Herbaspirillum frisingense TaxID=92645 RepID=A0A7V8FVE1_9BURK|nr:MAG: hypothetical protein GAK35_02828 [Herbaspirillum frisingense]